MNKEYKTFEELKEELGDKFEEFMYKANIELLDKVNQLETNRDELKHWLISMINANEHWYNEELTTHDKKYYLENYRITNLSLKNVIEKIEELERGKE